MKTITRDELVSILNYDPETGIFTWKKPYGTRVKAGSVAGTLAANGYIRIKINGSKFQAHRLAMLYVHGTLPPADTDHINRLKSDNRIANLREATRSENKKNSPANKNSISGCKGVSQRSSGKWRAIYWDGARNINLGTFEKLEDADKAYQLFKPVQPKQEQMSLEAA